MDLNTNVQNTIAAIQVCLKLSNHALVTVVAGWLWVEQLLVYNPGRVALMLN